MSPSRCTLDVDLTLNIISVLDYLILIIMILVCDIKTRTTTIVVLDTTQNHGQKESKWTQEFLC